MNKNNILKLLLDRLSAKLSSSTRALNKVHEDIEDSPSPSQSHSDTTRSQLSGVANEMTRMIEAFRRDSNILSKAISVGNIPENGSVEVWTVFEVENSTESNWYMILPIQGGESIEFEGILITFIGTDSPIALNSTGKVVGQEFVVDGKIFWISDLF